MISRTHVADIAAIIKKVVLSSKIKNQIFNISDNNPCPTNEVNNYICEELLKINKLPIGKDLKESRHSSFALDNKIVDNSKLKKILNYEFIFPSYNEGLKQISKQLNLI
jgi:nucleoside-diphosphate-sugar epimerase